MSPPEMDRNVRAQTGKRFPVDPLEETQATLSSIIAEALKRDFGSSPGQAKQIAQLLGVSPRTVKNWLQSQNGPNGAGLIVLMRHSDAVAAAVLKLADRHSESRLIKQERLRKNLRASMMALLDHLDLD